MKNIVSLHYCEDYSTKNISDALDLCLDDLGGLYNIVKPKSKILLKCHLATNSHPNEAKTTHPSLVISIAEKLAKLGATCIIADCPANSLDVNKVYETTQMLYASNLGNAELNLDERLQEIHIDGKMTKKLTVLQLAQDVDYIINMPKLILDQNFAIRGATDNLFGLIPSEMQEILRCKLFTPKDYNNYLLDIFDTFKNKIVLNILDGVVGSEMDGTQRIMNILAVSQNPVYLDALIYKILGLSTEDYSLFHEAKHREISLESCTFLGDELQNFKKENLALPLPNIEPNIPQNLAKKRKQIYLSTQQRPCVDASKCKGCKRCFSSCPVEAIEEGRDEYNEIFAKINLDKCITCLRCVRACPYQAIDVVIPAKYKTMQAKLDKRLTNE